MGQRGAHGRLFDEARPQSFRGENAYNDRDCSDSMQPGVLEDQPTTRPVSVASSRIEVTEEPKPFTQQKTRDDTEKKHPNSGEYCRERSTQSSSTDLGTVWSDQPSPSGEDLRRDSIRSGGPDREFSRSHDYPLYPEYIYSTINAQIERDRHARRPRHSGRRQRRDGVQPGSNGEARVGEQGKQSKILGLLSACLLHLFTILVQD